MRDQRDSRDMRDTRDMRDSRDRPTPGDWGRVAEWYDDLVGIDGSEMHQKVVHPGVLKLLGELANRTVLDVACGQGVLCRLLHQKGATIVGIDAAGPLISAAEKHGPADIRYQVIDAQALDKLPQSAIEPQTFDLATCILAIQNIAMIRPVFAGIAQRLKPGGRVVVVMMHPCFRNPGESHWGWDAEKNVQFRRVDRYLLPRKHPIVTHPGKNDGKYTWSFHRPIGDYIKAMSGAGLLIDTMQEWPSHKKSEPGPRAQAENTAREEIPMFLALAATKIAITKVTDPST